MMCKRFKCLLIIALLSSVTTLVAKKIDGYFVSRVEEKGTIYFLFPQELFRSEGDGKMLEHDLTVRPECDTTVFNFTYKMASATPIDSVAVTSKDGLLVGRKVNRLYIEPDGRSEWTHRYSLVGHYDEFLKFYSVDSPAQVTLYSKDGKTYRYVADTKAWKRYAPVGSSIFEMIKYNVD